MNTPEIFLGSMIFFLFITILTVIFPTDFKPFFGILTLAWVSTFIICVCRYAYLEGFDRGMMSQDKLDDLLTMYVQLGRGNDTTYGMQQKYDHDVENLSEKEKSKFNKMIESYHQEDI